MLDHWKRFCRYNRWANSRVYDAAAALSEADRNADRGAFFGSVHRTLNHIVVADAEWMNRLEGLPSALGEGQNLDTVTHPVWADLCAAREALDDRIATYVDGLSEAALHEAVDYTDTYGNSHRNTPAEILSHFFNHQTHHRGQAHDLICQLAGDAPVLDLMAMMREEA